MIRGPYKKRPTAARFASKYLIQSDGCWIWTGAVSGSGYGSFYIDGRYTTAHRASWLLSGRLLHDGKQLDHLCRVRLCVNPAHLEEVDAALNMARRPNSEATRTHCPKGHAYDDTNTRVTNGKRTCITCIRAAKRRSYAAKRSTQSPIKESA